MNEITRLVVNIRSSANGGISNGLTINSNIPTIQYGEFLQKISSAKNNLSITEGNYFKNLTDFNEKLINYMKKSGMHTPDEVVQKISRAMKLPEG